MGPLMDPIQISETSAILCDCRNKLSDIVENRYDLPNSTKIFGQVVREFSNLRKTMDSFQYVEVLENIVTEIDKKLLEAQNVIHSKKSIMRQQSPRQEPVKVKSTKARPQSPLSPMIYPEIYDPLSKKDKSKKSKKLSYRELEDKLNNLDLLEQDVLPTQVNPS